MSPIHQTVFLYDRNQSVRGSLLRFLTENSNYRVLCLDFLIQTLKQALIMSPKAILCNPGGDFKEVAGMLHEVKENPLTCDIAVYILGGNIPQGWADEFLRHGVKYIFERNDSMDTILRVIQSGRGMGSFVTEPVLKIERQDQDVGVQFELITFAFNKNEEFNHQLLQLMKHEFPVDSQKVVLDLTYVDNFAMEDLKLLHKFISKCKTDLLPIELIMNFKHLNQYFPRTEIPQHTTLQAYLSEIINVSPIGDAAQKIADTDDLEDLLNMIPD